MKQIAKLGDALALKKILGEIEALNAEIVEADAQLAKHRQVLADAIAHHEAEHAEKVSGLNAKKTALQDQLTEVAGDVGVDPVDAADVDVAKREVLSSADVAAKRAAEAAEAAKKAVKDPA